MSDIKIGFTDRLNLIKAAFSTNQNNVINSMTTTMQKFMPSYGEPPTNSSTNWIKSYNNNPRMNPVHQIASDVANANFKIYLNTDEKKIDLKNHALRNLFNNPCPDICLNFNNIMYITQVYLLLPSGEAFWLKERNGAGGVTQLWPVPPNWVMQIPSQVSNYFLIQPLGNMSAAPIPVYPEDMVYFKKLNVVNPYLRGIGRLNAIGDEIETDEYMAKFQKKYFYNNAIPPMVGMMPGADEAAIKRADEKWNQKYGGYNNSHKIAWLGWDAKIEILKETTKEMDFVESRRYLRDTANQHFSIPPEIFGILENSNRSTIDAAYYLYTRNVLSKELKFIASVINRQILSDFDKNSMLEFENVVPEDEEFALTKSNDGVGKGTVTVDEWRIANKMEELPDGKGKVLYVPNNLTAILLTGKSIPEEIAANKPKPPEKLTFGSRPIPEKLEENIPIKNAKALSNDKIDDEEIRFKTWETFDKAAIKGEPNFEKEMEKFFIGQEKRILSGLEKSYEAKTIDESDIDKENWKSEDAILLETMTPLWKDNFENGFKVSNELYSFGISFNIVNPSFVEWIKTDGLDQAKRINDTTKNDLRNTIAQGIDSGEGNLQMRQRIRDVFTTAKESRVRAIAKTETHNSVLTGTYYTYKAAGVKKKEWLSIIDSKTRDNHRGTLNREVKGIDELFSNGLLYPGAPGPAKEVIHCRCSLLAVIDLDALIDAAE